MREKTNPPRGSHLPALMKLVGCTSGPVLELGCGMYSSPYLHWACYPTERRLVTVEGNPEWFAFIRQFETPWHEVVCCEDWAAVDLSRHWSVALVDHSPNDRRWQDLRRLGHAEYVVAHDAENSQGKKYQYHRAHDVFRYRTKYHADRRMPMTAIFSNLHDVRGLVL